MSSYGKAYGKGGGTYLRGAYKWSNGSVKREVGLSAGGLWAEKYSMTDYSKKDPKTSSVICMKIVENFRIACSSFRVSAHNKWRIQKFWGRSQKGGPGHCFN